jgi:butyrate kinase
MPLMQDPMSSDELFPMNRVSSIAGITKKSRYHACECAAMLAQAAAGMELTRPDELDAIAVYYDDAVTVAALRKGVCVEVNDMIGGEGPMGFRASGDVPGVQLAEYRFTSGKSIEELREMLGNESGVLSYLATDCPEKLDSLVKSGDGNARLIVDAMAYQTAKWVGMCALALRKPDVILVAGKGARCDSYGEALKKLVGAVAPLRILPALDMTAYLAACAVRAGTVDFPLIEY